MRKIFLTIVTLLTIAFGLVGCTNNNQQELNEALEKIEEKIEFTNDDTKDKVIGKITLPTKIDEVDVKWISENVEVISNDGVVNRQPTDKKVKLHAVLTYKNNSKHFQIEVNVAKEEKDSSALIAEAKTKIENKIIFANNDNKELVTANITLPTEIDEVEVFWVSSDESVVNSLGEVTRQDEDKTVVLTATLLYDNEIDHYQIKLNVLKELSDTLSGVVVYSGDFVNYTDGYLTTQENSLALKEKINLVDGSITASIKANKPGEHGLIFRANDGGLESFWKDEEASYYKIFIDSNGHVVLGKTENGQWISLSSSEALMSTYDVNTTYKLTVNFNGEFIEVFIGDALKPIIEYRDINPLGGLNVGYILTSSYTIVSDIEVSYVESGFAGGVLSWQPKSETGYFVEVDNEKVKDLTSDELFYNLNTHNYELGTYEVKLYAKTVTGSELINQWEWRNLEVPTHLDFLKGTFVSYGSDLLVSNDIKALALEKSETLDKGIINGLIKPNVPNDSGIIFGVDDGDLTYMWETPGSSYYVALINQEGIIILGKIIGNVWTSVAESQIIRNSFDPQNSYEMKILFSEAQIKIFINKQLAIDYIDPNPLTGQRYGYRAGAIGVEFGKIEITDFQLTEIEIEKAPNYNVSKGANLELENAQIKAVFEDGSTKIVPITEEMISDFDSNEIGVQTVTVTYNLNEIIKTTTFEIMVREADYTLEAIEIVKPPKNLTLYQGQTLDLADAEIKLIFSDGNTELIEINSNMLSDFNNEEVKTHEVVISYTWGETTKTTSFEVEILKLTLLDVEFVKTPNRIQIAGDEIEFVIKAYYSNNTTEIVPVTPEMITGLNVNHLGNQDLIITYTVRDVTKTLDYSLEFFEGRNEYYNDFDELEELPSDFRVELENKSKHVVEIKDGRILVNSNLTDANAKAAVMYDKDLEFSNYKIETVFNIKNNVNDTRWLGIYFRLHNGGYSRIAMIGYNDVAKFMEWNGDGVINRGTWGPTGGSASIPQIEKDKDYHLAIYVIDMKAYVVLDGALVLEENIPERYVVGNVGLMTAGLQVYFDDFAVTEIKNDISKYYGIYDSNNLQIELGTNQTAAIVESNNQYFGTYFIDKDLNVEIEYQEAEQLKTIIGKLENDYLLIGDEKLFLSNIKTIELKGIPESLFEDEELDISKARIETEFLDGTKETVYLTEEMIVKNEQVGQILELEIIYQTESYFKVFVHQITIVQKELLSLEILNLPANMVVYENEELALDESEIVAYYEYGKSREVELEELMISGFDNLTLGKQTVTLTLEEGNVSKSVSFNVYVAQNDVIYYQDYSNYLGSVITNQDNPIPKTRIEIQDSAKATLTIAEEGLNIDSTLNSTSINIVALEDQISAESYLIEAEVSYSDFANTTRWAGVVFAQTEYVGYYSFNLRPNGIPSIGRRIVHETNGSLVSGGSWPGGGVPTFSTVGFNPNTKYKLSVLVNQGEAHFYIDDTYQNTFTFHEGFVGGGVGFASAGMNTTLHSFRILEVDPSDYQ